MANNLRPLSRLLVAAVLAFVVTISLSWTVASRHTTHAEGVDAGYQVVRIYYDDIQELEGLAAYDVWEVNNTAEKYVLAAVDQSDYEELAAAGWRLDLDINAMADVRHSAISNDFVEGYRTVDELYADMNTLAQNYPQLAQVITYGQSECLAAGGCETPGGDLLAGYDLRALRITNDTIPGASTINENDIVLGEKPVLFLMANIHAREITTPELAMRLAEWLLDGYGQNAEATWLVDWHEIWIVPTANPDGHWLVELGTTPDYGGSPFFHRKNANQDADGDGIVDCDQWPSSDFSQFGVDLNRNHTFGWGLPGSSGQPCDLTYRGPSAASELEVSSLESLIGSLIPDQRGEDLNDPAPDDTKGLFITLHSYSNLVLWPWGASYDDAPNRDGLKAIGDKLASFNGYLSCQPTDCLYAASGASDDWAYGTLGIPAFTFEIGDEFMPNISEVDSTQWPENKLSFIYAARIARTPYLTALGPDSMNASATADHGTAMFEVVLNDLYTGNQTIAAGELSIDKPFWLEDSVSIPMSAIDGSFDSQIETTTAVMDVDGLTPGRHLVYFRGQDSGGNWGAVTAAFLEIDEQGTLTHQSFVPMIVKP